MTECSDTGWWFRWLGRWRRATQVVVVAQLLAVACAPVLGQDANRGWLPRRAEHAWGSFLPGSWKVVRIVATDFDADGKAIRRTTTRTETVLSDASDEECVLSVRTATTVTELQGGGEPQQFGSEPTEIVLPLFGSAKDTAEETETLTIGGRKFRVRIWESRRQVEGKIESRKVWYRRGEIPAVLKETVSVAPAGNPSQSLLRWESQVTTFGVSLRVLDDRCIGWQVHTVRTTPTQTTTTTEYHCRDVPGTLVSASTSVTNGQGQVIRQSELTLEAYGACYEKGMPSRRARRRARRRREPSPEEAKSEADKSDRGTARERTLATDV